MKTQKKGIKVSEWEHTFRRAPRRMIGLQGLNPPPGSMLRDLTEKEGSVQGQMDNVGREIEILRKKLKGYIKNEQ